MSGANFVSPTGYIDLDNDCEYSLDNKSTRSREYIDPKQDLSFYFDTYLAPKYGLNNINVGNVASFMKELQMNWSKLTPSLKDNVLDILMEIIFNKDSEFKTQFLTKLGVTPNSSLNSSSKPTNASSSDSFMNAFGVKSSFGNNSTNILYVLSAIALLVLVIYLLNKSKQKVSVFSKMI